jgi:hypothetical protein
MAANAPNSALPVEKKPTINPALTENIPVELRGAGCFLRWRYVSKPGKKSAKCPVNASGRKRGYADTKIHLSFAEAENVANEDSCGLGISLKENGLLLSIDWTDQYLWCLDLDGFVELGGDRCDDGVKGILDRTGSYTEVSPSGTGLKVLFLSDKPPENRNHIKFGPSEFAEQHPEVSKYQNREIEVFSRGLFLTLTGELWSAAYTKIQSVTETELDELLEWLHEKAVESGGTGLPAQPKVVQGATPSSEPATYSKLAPASLETVLKYVDPVRETAWSGTANALARAYGEEGREFFIRYSRGDYSVVGYKDFDLSEVNKRFERALEETELRPDGYGTKHLIELARSHEDWPSPELSYEDDAALSFDVPEDFCPPQGLFPPKLDKASLVDQIPVAVENVRETKAGMAVVNEEHGQSEERKVGPIFQNTEGEGAIDVPRRIAGVNERFGMIECVGIYDKELGMYVSPAQFNLLYANRKIKLEHSTKRVPLSKDWAESPHRAQYRGLEIAPGQPERTQSGCLNIYRGYSIKRAEGDVAPFLELLEWLIPDDDSRKYLLSFIAYKYQNPAAQYAVATILWSLTQGVGKNLIAEVLVSLFHVDHWVVRGQEVFSDQFTEWKHRKLFCILDEVSSTNTRPVADRIKGWITATENSINAKNQPKFDERNLIAHIFLSNSPDAVFMDASDRRYWVYHCREQQPTPGLIQQFVGWRDSGGREHLLDYLLKYDTSSFSPFAHARMTHAKQEMIEDNKSDLERWLSDILSAASITKLLGRDLVTAEELARLYQGSESRRIVSSKAVNSALKRLGVKRISKQARLANGARPRVYALANEVEYEAMTDVALGEVLDKQKLKIHYSVTQI